jgi:hypothetical protein
MTNKPTNRQVHRLNEENTLVGSDAILLLNKYLQDQSITSTQDLLCKIYLKGKAGAIRLVYDKILKQMKIKREL